MAPVQGHQLIRVVNAHNVRNFISYHVKLVPDIPAILRGPLSSLFIGLVRGGASLSKPQFILFDNLLDTTFHLFQFRVPPILIRKIRQHIGDSTQSSLVPGHANTSSRPFFLRAPNRTPPKPLRESLVQIYCLTSPKRQPTTVGDTWIVELVSIPPVFLTVLPFPNN